VSGNEPRATCLRFGRVCPSRGIGARNVSERTLVLSQHRESQFYDGTMYRGTGNVYANLWRVRGLVCGDFEVSLCKWPDRGARFRWNCLFENCKHAQTYSVVLPGNGNDVRIRCWGDRYMYSCTGNALPTVTSIVC
jgi:hypothetical protein